MSQIDSAHEVPADAAKSRRQNISAVDLNGMHIRGIQFLLL
jgi:hypothetical protein